MAVSLSQVKFCRVVLSWTGLFFAQCSTQRLGLEGPGVSRMDCSLDLSSLLCKITILPPTLYLLWTVQWFEQTSRLNPEDALGSVYGWHLETKDGLNRKKLDLDISSDIYLWETALTFTGDLGSSEHFQ